jgi:hypothetical protein
VKPGPLPSMLLIEKKPARCGFFYCWKKAEEWVFFNIRIDIQLPECYQLGRQY